RSDSVHGLSCTVTHAPARYTLSLHDALPILPMTAPMVGVPTTLPKPSARNPAGNISAFEAERQFCKTTFGPKYPANGRPDASVPDRKSTRLNSSHVAISYAVFCLKKKNKPLY